MSLSTAITLQEGGVEVMVIITLIELLHTQGGREEEGLFITHTLFYCYLLNIKTKG